MTRLEHLLGKVAQECAELAQRASKAQEFGPSEVQPGQPLSNIERMELEFNDVLAAVEMLNAQLRKERYGVGIQSRIDLVELKKEKVEELLKYARERGTLSDY